MNVKEILREVELGSSVAEFDSALESYFVETQTFRQLINGQVDIVAGDKGTGKTALHRILHKRYASIPQLKTVEVLPGFNPSGSPVFQRLAEMDPLTEQQYLSIWKLYVFSLIGNWLLQLYGGDGADAVKKVETLLQQSGLRTVDDSPNTVFGKLMLGLKRLIPKGAQLELSMTPAGQPTITPKLDFGDGKQEVAAGMPFLRHEEALGALDSALQDADLTIWLVLDRLDEAFQGHPTAEVPALRALFRCYLDLAAFDRIKLKLFVRKDLFRKLTRGGFVNLTHVNARKVEIVWDQEDLLNLLCRRVRENKVLIQHLHLEGQPDDKVFYAVFPARVDPGLRKPTTWTWIVNRIRDGNDVKPPRNLIDLVKKAQEAQLRREDRDPRAFAEGVALVEPDALRRGLSALSEERVLDTLLAEAGDEYAEMVEKFRDGKAEHNEESLARVLGTDDAKLIRSNIKILMDIGFLEQVGDAYKIPMLYREGLGVTQGKAYAPSADVESEDES